MLARAAGTFAKIVKEPAPSTLSLRLVRLPSNVEKLIDSAELLKEVEVRPDFYCPLWTLPRSTPLAAILLFGLCPDPHR